MSRIRGGHDIVLLCALRSIVVDTMCIDLFHHPIVGDAIRTCAITRMAVNRTSLLLNVLDLGTCKIHDLPDGQTANCSPLHSCFLYSLLTCI